MGTDTIRNANLKPDFKELEEQWEDIQGLVRRGYKSLLAARYIFFSILTGDGNIDTAKQYFKQLVAQYITTGRYKAINGYNDPSEAVQLAFTSMGLKKLIKNECILETFSREFIEGMSFCYKDENVPPKEIRERSTLLGDTGCSAPEHWHWGFGEKVVDGVLMLYASDPAALDNLTAKVFTNLQKGLTEIYRSDTSYNGKSNAPIEKEHFGFKDGISQPIIKGLQKSLDNYDEEQLVEKGELVLGYKNAYQKYSPSPYVTNDGGVGLPEHPTEPGKKDLGKNGTYMVFRQIKQDVKKFWLYQYNNSKESGDSASERAIKLAAKMVGRWPNGQPLVKCPVKKCDPTDDKKMNDFYYLEKDPMGLACPFGAHIRRSNPRDQVHAGRNQQDSLEVTAKHRMLRRGRIYGPLLDDELDSRFYLGKIEMKEWTEEGVKELEKERGLHFICLVTDISRQFEFVQSVWSNTSTFAQLNNEVDPIIGARPKGQQPSCDTFTTPQTLVRNRYSHVQEFTNVTGGAYFFLPGIKALKFITT